MRISQAPYVLIATALTLAAFPVHANVLLPGDSNKAPDVFPDPGDVSPLASTIGTFSFGSGAGLITGTYFEAVVVDPLGITCPGCLDFAFQVNLDPGLSAGIFDLYLGGFRGFTTDVGYVEDSGIAPISVSRGLFGGTVSFRFVSPDNTSNVIGPGGSSAILAVVTNATAYDAQGAIGISGGRAGSPADGQIDGVFEPVLHTSIPEPCTALLLGFGLAGFGLLRKRTWRV